LELVDASDMVPGLKFRRGVSNWIVSDKFGTMYKTFAEVPEKVHSLLRPSMFPPEAADAEKFHLVTPI
jgi:tRNA (cytosine34-C5)-methyltransferase